MTQEQITELMKISVTYYGRLEQGEKTINLERLTEISQLLGGPAVQLLEDAPVEEKAKVNVSSPFLEQMIHYSHHCSAATLKWMLAVCAALATEDAHK